MAKLAKAGCYIRFRGPDRLIADYDGYRSGVSSLWYERVDALCIDSYGIFLLRHTVPLQ